MWGALLDWLRQPWALPALGAAAVIGLVVFVPTLREVVMPSEPMKVRVQQAAPASREEPAVTEGAEPAAPPPMAELAKSKADQGADPPAAPGAFLTSP